MRKLRITVSDAEDGIVLDMGVMEVSDSCRTIEVKGQEDRDISESYLELVIGSAEKPTSPAPMSARVPSRVPRSKNGTHQQT
jgi:hypothetical protein